MGDAVKELRRELNSVRHSIKENEERYAGLSAEDYESLGNAYVELNLGLRERETELVEAIRVEMERRVERMERSVRNSYANVERRRREAAEAEAENERRVERMERRRREVAEAKAENERRVERMERRRREVAEAKAKESKNESDDDMPFYRKPK